MESQREQLLRAHEQVHTDLNHSTNHPSTNRNQHPPTKRLYSLVPPGPSLNRARGTHMQVEETGWFTRSARQVLNSIHYRNIRHKACLIGIIIFLMALIILVFWQGVLKRYKK